MDMRIPYFAQPFQGQVARHITSLQLLYQKRIPDNIKALKYYGSTQKNK